MKKFGLYLWTLGIWAVLLCGTLAYVLWGPAIVDEQKQVFFGFLILVEAFMIVISIYALMIR